MACAVFLLMPSIENLLLAIQIHFGLNPLLVSADHMPDVPGSILGRDAKNLCGKFYEFH